MRKTYYEVEESVKFSSALIDLKLSKRLQALKPYIRLRQVLSTVILNTTLPDNANLPELPVTNVDTYSLTLYASAKLKIEKEALHFDVSISVLYTYYLLKVTELSELYIKKL